MNASVYLCLISALAAVAAETPSDSRLELADVIRQREENLKQRVDLINRRTANGITDGMSPAASADAQIDLLTFRRDQAADWGEKIEWQRQIVRLCAQATAACEKRSKSGTGDLLEVLDAKKRELAALQQLLEWQKERPTPSADASGDGSPHPSAS